MPPGVSVVIPIFGDVHLERLMPTIDSIRMQRGIHEIIVSEQSHTGMRCRLTLPPEVIHLFSEPEMKDGKVEFNAGIARNEGLKRARMEYVYFNDADTVFLDADYLERLCATIQEREILIRTAMWRLLTEEVPSFVDLQKKHGIAFSLTQLTFLEHFQATLSANPTRMIPVSHDNRLFTSTPALLERYASDNSLHGQENLLWQRTVHCGATFGKTKDIESVGGYSTAYPVCTYEDSDLQWKLAERFSVRTLDADPTLRVLHLDHALPYRSVELEARNKMIFEQRKNDGIEQCIQTDVRNYHM